MADSKLSVSVDPRGAVTGSQKAVKAIRAIATAAERTETSLKKLESRTVKVRVDGRALSNLKRTATSVETSLRAISKVTVKPKVDARALTNLRNTAKSVASSLKQINSVSVKPKTNLRPVTDLTKAARTAKTSLKDINKIKVAPSVNPAGVVALEATMGTLIKAVGVLTTAITALNTNLARSGVVGAASMGRIATGANAATAAVGRLGAASAAAGTTAGLSSAGAGAATALAGLRGRLGAYAKGSAAANTATNTLKKSFKLLKGGVIALAAAVGLAAGTLLATTIKFSDAAIMIRNRIRLVTRSTEELNAVNGALMRQARDARVPLAAHAELYQRIGLSMKQLGADTQAVLAATEATAKAITLSAVTFQAANATIIQFGQSLAFGKLRGDELRSVLEQSPRLAQALADGLGIARGELIKFGFAGKLSSERVFKALLSQLPKLREEFKTIKPRISEAGTVLQNSFINMSGAINDATDVGTGFARIILSIADSIDENVPNMIRTILSLELAWIRASRNVVQFFADIKNGFATMPDAAQSMVPGFLSDQAIIGAVNKPVDTVADLLRKPNFTELNALADYLQSFGLAIQFVGSQAGKSIDPVTGFLGALSSGTATLDAQKAVNDASKVVEDLYALSLERERLGELVQARDYARDVQKVDKLPFKIGDTEITGNVKLEVEAQEALDDLVQLRKDFAATEALVIKASVQIDLPAAKAEVIRLQEQLALAEKSGASKTDKYYTDLKAKLDLYKTVIAEVEASGQFLVKNGRNDREIDASRAAFKAISAVRAPAVDPLALPEGGNRTDLQNQRDPTADTRAVNAYIDKQKQLIVELSFVEGVERDLAQLRLKAGDVAVNKATAQINANQEIIDSLQKVRDLEEEGEAYVDSLQEQIDKLQERGEAEKIGDFLASHRIRTAAEQEQVDNLQKELLATNDVDEATAGLIITESQLLALQIVRANTVSAAKAAELKATYDLAKAKEDELYAEQELNDARDITKRRAEEGVRTPAGQRAAELKKLHEDYEKSTRLLKILEAQNKKYMQAGLELTRKEQEALENAREAVELFQQDIIEANQLFQDFTIDSVEAVRDVAQQMNAAMSDFFFDAMQGNFDDLLQNLVGGFKAAIDRMVADALAAQLMDKLVNNGGFVGDFLGMLIGAPSSDKKTSSGGVTGAYVGTEGVPGYVGPPSPEGSSLTDLGGPVISLDESTQQTVTATTNGASLIKGAVDMVANKVFGRGDEIGSITSAVDVRPVLVTKVLMPVSLSQSTISQLTAASGGSGGGGGVLDFIGSMFGMFGGGGGGTTGNYVGIEGAPGFVGPPSNARGGFVGPGEFTEINELGQEALILGAKRFLIPMGEEISRSTPPALMGQVRGLASGGFAKPSEMVEINERGLEALRMGDVTKMLGSSTQLEGGIANSMASGVGALQGSLSKDTALGGATLVSLPGSFPPPSPGQESLPRSGTAQFYTDDAARRLQETTDNSSTLPKIYSMDGRTFMRMGSSGGFVIPHDKTNELIQKETMGKIPGREFGGSVQSRSVFEVNEGVLPELLTIGSRDFLLTGGSSGYVTPMENASQLGTNQTINMTIVTPDVDGFRKSQSQISNEMGRASSMANRRNG